MFGSSGIRSTTASHQRPLVADFRMPLGAVSGVESADHSSFGTLKVHVLGRAPLQGSTYKHHTSVTVEFEDYIG